MNLISSNQAEIDIKKFKKIKRISKGGFGVVYKVEEKETGELFAAKIIDCNDDEEMCNQMIKREITIMMYARHPTIIKFIGYSKIDFHEENNITIIMELAKNGSLKNVIKKIQEGDGPKDYTNTSRQIILVGVARGMKYLHDRSIIHRDLKTDNILLDEDFRPHITDFGLSKFIETGHTRSQTKFGGTLQYEAPEILQGLKYDQKVDVYSFAILMFEVLTDSVPFPELEKEDFNAFNFISKIINDNYRPKFTVPVKKSFKNLIERCWSKNPEERPEFGEIFTILSNKNNNHEDEDFILDDVDVDEFNLYVEDITEVTDSTEKLLSKISQKEAEIKKLKDEIKRQNDAIESFRNDKKKYENEIKKLKTENSELTNSMDKYKNEIKKLKTQNNELVNSMEKYENEIKKLKTQNDELTNSMEKYENEIKKLKTENNELKSSMEKHENAAKEDIESSMKRAILVAGFNDYNRLGGESNNENEKGNSIISPPAELPFDPSSLLSYSANGDHSVLITNDGTLKGIGYNRFGEISRTLEFFEAYDFSDFYIKDGRGHQLIPVSAACCGFSTLYMLRKNNSKGMQLVLCDQDINNGKPVFLNIGNHEPVSLFGGYYHSAAIGNKGEVIFINRNSVKNSPNSPIEAVSLPGKEKASSVACCDNSVVVLSSNGRVFESPINEENNNLKFSPVSELESEEIVCLSGTDEHCFAVNKKGRVFGRGSNRYGQLGLKQDVKTTTSFTRISSLKGYEIRAAYAGCNHSLFETREGKILSCGENESGELLLSSGPGENVYLPTETSIKSGAVFCIAGAASSVVFIGKCPPPNTPNMRIHEFE